MARKPKSQEPWWKFYAEKLSELSRWIFGLALAGVGFVCTEKLVRYVLAITGIAEHDGFGHSVYVAVEWMSGGAYLFFVGNLILRDASEHASETWEQLKRNWGKKP